MDNHSGSAKKRLPAGIKGVGIFLAFGVACALLAGITLTWRGTIVDRIWQLNSRAYQELAPLGRLVGIPFLLLSVMLAAASYGWFHCRLWAWRLTTGIIATQLQRDLANIFMGHTVEGAVGVTISGVLLLYLAKANVKTVFS